MEITRDIAAKVLEVVDAGLTSGMGIAEPGKMCVEAAVCYALGEPHGDEPSCVAPVLRSLKIRLNDAAWSSNQIRAKGLRRLALSQLGSRGALDEKEFTRRVVDYALRVSTPVTLRAAAAICKNKDHIAGLIAAAVRCEAEGTREAALEGRTAAYACTTAYAAAAAYAAINAANVAANAADAYAATATADAAANAANAANAAAYTANAAAHAANAAAHAANAANAAAYAANAATYAANAAHAAAHAAAAATHAANAYYAAFRDRALAKYAEVVVQILIEMRAPGCQWLGLAPLEVVP